jgi:hypothetical protein
MKRNRFVSSDGTEAFHRVQAFFRDGLVNGL